MDETEIKYWNERASKAQPAPTLDHHKKLRRHFEDLQRIIADKNTDSFTKMRAEHGLNQLKSQVKKFVPLLYHKCALIFKMQEQGKTPADEAELAAVQAKIRVFADALAKCDENVETIVKPRIKGGDKFVSDQHWASLSQKAKLRKAVE